MVWMGAASAMLPRAGGAEAIHPSMHGRQQWLAWRLLASLVADVLDATFVLCCVKHETGGMQGLGGTVPADRLPRPSSLCATVSQSQARTMPLGATLNCPKHALCPPKLFAAVSWALQANQVAFVVSTVLRVDVGA